MNVKKTLLAVIVVAVLWWLTDFVIHGMLLMDTYKLTPNLWRPMEEMNMGLGIAKIILFALLYVLFYSNLVAPKNVSQGVKFGLWYGLLGGLAMAGCYLYMPISEGLALSWFAANLVQSLIAGAAMGWITKD
jgi:hypothetical protein